MIKLMRSKKFYMLIISCAPHLEIPGPVTDTCIKEKTRKHCRGKKVVIVFCNLIYNGLATHIVQKILVLFI